MISYGYGRSVRGKKREVNEDSFFIDDDSGLYIVADGIGGDPWGELASSIAVRSAAEHIAEQSNALDAIRTGEEPEEAAVEIVEQALIHACGEIFRTAQKNSEFTSMGSTATIVLFLGKKVAMGHVGNTRLYLYRDGHTHQLSQDHTIAAEYVRRNVITAAEEREHTFRNVLTRSLGTQPSTVVDTLLFDLSPQDRLLLCSNGLSSALQDADLHGFFKLDFEEIADALIHHAASKDETDDMTTVVIRPSGEFFEELKSSSSYQSVNQYIEILGSLQVFEALSLRQLQRVLNLGRAQRFDERETLVTEGRDCPYMIVVLEGSVSVTRKGEKIGIIKPGDAAQEISLASARPSSGTYRTLEPSHIWMLEREEFKRLALQFPRIGLTVLGRLSELLTDEVDRKTNESVRLSDAGMGFLNM